MEPILYQTSVPMSTQTGVICLGLLTCVRG
jgi:hypothetical protein